MTTDDRAERLARLQARRSSGTAGPASTASSPDASTPAATTEPTTATAPSSPPGRRRSPALSAKVLTVGASTTAMLGMMAGYGFAEARAERTPTLQSGSTDGTGALAATPAPGATTLSTSPTTSPPQVIVVVIDDGSGHPIDADAVARAAIDGDPAGGVPSATDAPPAAAPDARNPPAAPAPPAAPRPVAVAVDVPTPVPVAASAPAPAPAPPPEATSGGS